MDSLSLKELGQLKKKETQPPRADLKMEERSYVLRNVYGL